MGERPRTLCGDCGQPVPITKAGTLYWHQRGVGLDCSGSGSVVVPHVHACACGVRWDEDCTDG